MIIKDVIKDMDKERGKICYIPNKCCKLIKNHSLRFKQCLNCWYFAECLECIKKKRLYKIPKYIQNDKDNFFLFFDIYKLQWNGVKK
jgi:hypothetical protein